MARAVASETPGIADVAMPGIGIVPVNPEVDTWFETLVRVVPYATRFDVAVAKTDTVVAAAVASVGVLPVSAGLAFGMVTDTAFVV
jgi:hypothetical protein